MVKKEKLWAFNFKRLKKPQTLVICEYVNALQKNDIHPNKYKAGMSSISHKNKFEIIAKAEHHDTNL